MLLSPHVDETTSPSALLYTHSPSPYLISLTDSGAQVVVGRYLVAGFVLVLGPSQLQDFLESARAFLISPPCADSEISRL